jgi:hypothetical protein
MARVVNGIEVERFLALEGQVLEPVPQERRPDFVYWRAGHLGAVALNFLKGDMFLNSAWGVEVEYSHFQLEYSSALNRARSMRTTHTQFSEPHRRELAELADVPEDFDHPSMVFALDASFNDGSRIKFLPDLYDLDDFDTFTSIHYRSPFSPCGGHIFYGPLHLSKIDPYSHQTIKEIFGLPAAK